MLSDKLGIQTVTAVYMLMLTKRRYSPLLHRDFINCNQQYSKCLSLSNYCYHSLSLSVLTAIFQVNLG